ncbi:SGNH/GDSL hydrolase family protein [Salinisphaera sp. SWV1]|uniref:SGNH/GDSL hydrolase family protein n=1 Tax=Salinisphaera sp. SWV1 TaxID=3454139 RepID=UPI003F864385
MSALVFVGYLGAASAAATVLTGGSTVGPGYTGLYVFGDSLSDAGNVYTVTAGSEPISPPYSNGRFTNGNVWVQDLAASLGLGAVTPSITGGNDFAFGGAQTGPTNANPYNSSNPNYPANLLTDLPAQRTTFDSVTHNGANAKTGALYTLWIGANDLDALTSSALSGPIQPLQINTDLSQAIANISNFVNDLAGDGMQNLLALNVPDLSKTPNAIAATGNDAAKLALIRSLTADFNASLSQALNALAQADGFALTQVDTFSALDQAVADPAAYDFTNVTDPCWTGNFTSAAPGSVCSDPSQYLFWDGLHPTAAAHQIIADAAAAALSARAVAEPNSATLLLAGVIGMLLLCRRRATVVS